MQKSRIRYVTEKVEDQLYKRHNCAMARAQKKEQIEAHIVLLICVQASTVPKYFFNCSPESIPIHDFWAARKGQHEHKAPFLARSSDKFQW